MIDTSRHSFVHHPLMHMQALDAETHCCHETFFRNSAAKCNPNFLSILSQSVNVPSIFSMPIIHPSHLYLHSNRSHAIGSVSRLSVSVVLNHSIHPKPIHPRVPDRAADAQRQDTEKLKAPQRWKRHQRKLRRTEMKSICIVGQRSTDASLNLLSSSPLRLNGSDVSDHSY